MAEVRAGVPAARVDAPLEENMVLGVTPMVCEPGLGGIRLHDTVVVERDGARSLDPFPKGALAYADGVLTCDDVPVRIPVQDGARADGPCRERR